LKLGKDGIKRKISEKREDLDLADINPRDEAGRCS